MNEFLNMIYESWRKSEAADNEIDWGDYNEVVERIYNFLNEDIAMELETAINRRVWEVQKNAFIAGFTYAAKCLSNGEIKI